MVFDFRVSQLLIACTVKIKADITSDVGALLPGSWHCESRGVGCRCCTSLFKRIKNATILLAQRNSCILLAIAKSFKYTRNSSKHRCDVVELRNVYFIKVISCSVKRKHIGR